MTRLKNIILILFTVIILGCKGNTTTESKEIISVTIEPLRYFVEQIAGDEYKVNVIVPEGASPETYSPTASNMRGFEDSKLFISIGLLECEHNITERSKSSDMEHIELKNSISLIEGVCTGHDHDHTHNHESDVHIWCGPKEGKIIASVIKDKLSSINPSNKDIYNVNYNKLISSIDSLDNYITQKLSSLENRAFIIYHPSLGYFANAYSLQQIPMQEEGKESSGKRLKQIIDEGKNVKGIIYQSQFSKSSVEAVCNELSIDPILINPLDYDWLNSMYDITNKLYKVLN